MNVPNKCIKSQNSPTEFYTHRHIHKYTHIIHTHIHTDAV